MIEIKDYSLCDIRPIVSLNIPFHFPHFFGGGGCKSVNLINLNSNSMIQWWYMIYNARILFLVRFVRAAERWGRKYFSSRGRGGGTAGALLSRIGGTRKKYFFICPPCFTLNMTLWDFFHCPLFHIKHDFVVVVVVVVVVVKSPGSTPLPPPPPPPPRYPWIRQRRGSWILLAVTCMHAHTSALASYTSIKLQLRSQ